MYVLNLLFETVLAQTLHHYNYKECMIKGLTCVKYCSKRWPWSQSNSLPWLILTTQMNGLEVTGTFLYPDDDWSQKRSHNQ